MRLGSAFIFMLAALAAGCAPGSGGNASGNGAEAASAPTVSASLAGSACVLRWNGEVASAEAITARAVEVMQQAIAAAGGLASVTEDNMPFARIEAAPDTPYACFGTAIDALRRAGFAKAELPAPQRGVGGAGMRAAIILGAFSGTPPQVTVTLGADGRIEWNGENVDLAVLRQRARGLEQDHAPSEAPPPPPPGAAGSVPPPVEVLPPPGALALAPAAELKFVDFAAAVQAIFEGGVSPILP